MHNYMGPGNFLGRTDNSYDEEMVRDFADRVKEEIGRQCGTKTVDRDSCWLIDDEHGCHKFEGNNGNGKIKFAGIFYN